VAGVPGVKTERFEEGLQPRHCALSLVGEPIMYPQINEFVELLHGKGISSFLVTNAQFPDAVRYDAAHQFNAAGLASCCLDPEG